MFMLVKREHLCVRVGAGTHVCSLMHVSIDVCVHICVRVCASTLISRFCVATSLRAALRSWFRLGGPCLFRLGARTAASAAISHELNTKHSMGEDEV